MRVNTLYDTKELVTEQDRQIELRYYLVQDMASRQTQSGESRLGHVGVVTYGVGIVKIENGKEEREWLPGISHSAMEAEALLRQMANGLVTPTTAAEVADDWMGRWDLTETMPDTEG